MGALALVADNARDQLLGLHDGPPQLGLGAPFGAGDEQARSQRVAGHELRILRERLIDRRERIADEGVKLGKRSLVALHARLCRSRDHQASAITLRHFASSCCVGAAPAL